MIKGHVCYLVNGVQFVENVCVDTNNIILFQVVSQRYVETQCLGKYLSGGIHGSEENEEYVDIQ